MKKWSYLFILLGIMILAYPQVSEWYADWQQDRLLNEAESEAIAPSTAQPANLKSGYAKVNHLLNEESEQSTSAPAPVQGDILGIITIDKIGVKLPIVEGATRDNMRSAAVHISETDQLGQAGNFAIAAHRAHKYGRLFNRLNEVKIGDIVKIESRGKVFEYKADNISIVEPTDVSVLESHPNREEITLVTCDPLVNPTHRLIIHAERISTNISS